MDKGATEPTPSRHDTTTDRRGRELVVTRIFDAPARLVFAAWTTPELMLRWWAPDSFGITFLSCDVDARVGGRYRLVFANPDPNSDEPVAFVGRYLEVVPPTRLVWTNEESDDGPVTTVTFEEKDGRTLLTLCDRYPSAAALDEAIASGSTNGYAEQFLQLDVLLAEPAEPR
jgi:uncharacterized protein YndB with AHSA1/START domain